VEIATAEQMPKEPCNVHGDAKTRLLVDLPQGQWPRAALAVDTAQVAPVIVKAPTLIAENDPYNAVKSTTRAKPASRTADAEGLPDPTKPVLKAKPVEPAEDKPVEVRRAQPVRPLDEAPHDTILRAQPPPPSELDNG
jgi:hypothetical protein